MDNLPLARLSSAVAISDDTNLIIYLTGIVYGAGGYFVVKDNSDLIEPNPIQIYAVPGNIGITGVGLNNLPAQGAVIIPGQGARTSVVIACAAAPSPGTLTGIELVIESDLIDGETTLQVIKAKPAISV